MKPIWGFLLLSAGAATLASAGPAAAQQRWEASSENALRRADPYFDQDETDAFELRNIDLETGYETNNWLRFISPDGPAVWRFEQQVRYRGFFDRDDLDTLLLTPRIQYWRRFDDNRWQYRLAGWVGYLQRDGDSRYVRYVGEAQLRRRATAYHETVARIRFSHYDYNEDVLPGFDQDQIRIGLEHYWKPTGGTSYLRARYFYDDADAELDRAGFRQHIAQAAFLWQATERLRWTGAAEYRDRENGGPFSTNFPFALQQSRWRIEAGPEYAFSDNALAFLSIGAVWNDSNLASRDFSGLVFDLGFRLTF